MEFSLLASPHHVNVARSYIQAANTLINANHASACEDAPVFFLLSHGTELALKAKLSLCGFDSEEIEKLGHNLAAAYDKLNSNFTRDLEKHVSQKWREYLKAARVRYIQHFSEYGITDASALDRLGIANNQDIGDHRPKYVHDLNWLSQRHSHGGGAFRYATFGVDQARFVRAFGLDEPTVPKSITWGCEFILESVERDLSTRDISYCASGGG